MLNEYPTAGRWLNPFREMQRAQHEMNRLFGSLPSTARLEFPLVNLWANAEGAVVTAEVPGLSPEQIDVAVYQDTVSLSGKREPKMAGTDARVHRQERPHGAFSRTLVLPFHVDPDKVAARFDRGVLTLELPRPAADRPRKIQIVRV